MNSLIIQFLCFVQPFCAFVRKLQYELEGFSGNTMIAKLREEWFQEYLFTSKDKIWDSEKLSKVLRTQAFLSGIEGLTISSWRQIAVGIAWKHFMRGGLRMDFDDTTEEGLGFEGLDESRI